MDKRVISKHKTKLRKIGTGQGVLLSKALVDLMGMDLGDEFTIQIRSGEIILMPETGGR